MEKCRRHERHATPAPSVSATTSIRNVVLVGPSGSGKSRLFDHVVDAVVPGRVAPGQTEPTTGLRAASLATGKVVLTLLDAPGNPDFVGEVRAGLRAADAALFVVSAADGADAQSRALWHECSIVGMPRAVVITQLDARDADFAATLEDCQAHFGSGIQPLGVPVARSAGAVCRSPTCCSVRSTTTRAARRTVRPAGPEHADVFDTYRPALIEGIIEESEDGGLMDRYLEGEELDFDTLEKDLLTAVAHGTFHPVLPLSAETGAGVGVLLHLVEAAFPHPGLHPLPTVTPVGGGPAVELERRPRRPARRRGRPHRVRRLRRAPLARAGVLRDAALRPGRARVGPPRAARGADRRGPRRPRRGRPPGCGRRSPRR